MQDRLSPRFVNGSLVSAFVVLTVLILFVIIAVDRAEAQIQPVQLPVNCTGLQLDPNATCVPTVGCLGANTCSQWTTANPTPMCVNPNPANPGMNCLTDPVNTQICAVSGICVMNNNNICQVGAGNWPLTTNAVKQGGTCNVPGPGIPAPPPAPAPAPVSN